MNDVSEPREAAKTSRAKVATEVKSPAEWASAKSVPAWAMSGAMHAMRDTWVVGRDVSEDDFDKAIDAIRNMQFSSPAHLVKRSKARNKRGRR